MEINLKKLSQNEWGPGFNGVEKKVDLGDPKISIVVGMTRDRVIGNHNQLPWRISEDLKLFKQITEHNTVIMGRKTYGSIPEKFRPLPNRNNIVITSNPQQHPKTNYCNSIKQALEKAKEFAKPIFIIGGSSIYKEFLDLADNLYISHIKKNHEGNIFFPEINWNDWKIIEEKEYEEFIFKRYKRRTQSL